MRQAELRLRAARSSGPRVQYNLTTWARGKTVNVHLKPRPELEKARREVAEYERFRALTG